MTSLDIKYNIQYILIKTDYNERVVKNKHHCKHLQNTMGK